MKQTPFNNWSLQTHFFLAYAAFGKTTLKERTLIRSSRVGEPKLQSANSLRLACAKYIYLWDFFKEKDSEVENKKTPMTKATGVKVIVNP